MFNFFKKKVPVESYDYHETYVDVLKISQFVNGKENCVYEETFYEELTDEEKKKLILKYKNDILCETDPEKVSLDFNNKTIIFYKKAGPIKIYFDCEIF